MTPPIINEILNDIVLALKDNKNIISCSLVGSMFDKTTLEKFNDVDLVIVADKVHTNLLDIIGNLFKEIKAKFTEKELGITYTTRTGSIKILSYKPKTIMLHFIIISEESYKENLSPMLKLSFQKHPPLFGKPLSQIQKIEKIRKDDLLSPTNLGITAHKKCIESRFVSYFEYEGSKLTSRTKKLNDGEYCDFIFWATINAGKNTEIFLGHKLPSDLENFMKEMIKAKLDFRKGKKFTLKEIDDFKKRALEFMDSLEDIVIKS